MVITLSVFDSLTSVEPRPLSMEWAELSLLLSTHDFTFADKLSPPLYCPAEFTPGTTRAKRNVSRVHFGVVDIDKCAPHVVGALVERLRAEGQSFVFYTTWSHTKALERGLCSARLLVPFTRPVEAWEWEAVWSRMHVAFEGIGDIQCKDPSRVYFFPSAPAGTEEDAVTDINHGLPWDVDAARTQKKVEPPKVRKLGVKELQSLLKQLRGSRVGSKVWFREKLSALIEGESIAPIGERDDTVWRVACAILDEFPAADPRQLALLFAPSIQAMTLEAPDCPTVANVEDKIRRKQQETAEDEVADVQHSDAERRRLIRMAFDFEGGRDWPYTVDELQAFADAAGVTPRDFRAFWIIQRDASFYVFVGGRYRGPFTQAEVEKAAQQYLAPAHSAGVELYYSSAKTGGELTPKDVKRLMRDYGTLAAAVHIDMSAQVSYYDPTRRVIVEAPCPLRVTEPVYSPEVERWLILLGGEQASKLIDWVSVVTNVAEPCAALYLEGLKDVGKSLFAEGIAKLWTDRGSVALGDAMAAFNSSIVECPLVFADEAVPRDFRGQTRTGDLRQFIQARTRSLRRKYLADATFKGCVRLVLAANNADLISSNEALTINDIEAIVDRVVHIDANHAHGAREYLKELGRSRVAKFVTEDELAKHALWLRDNHVVETSHRFLVSGDKSKLHRRLTTSSGLRSAVCNWLVSYLLEPHKMDVMGSMLVRVNSGCLLVNVRALSQHWQVYQTNIDPPSTGQLSAALSGLSRGDSIQLTDGNGNRPHYRAIDRDNLVSWAEDNGFATAEAIDAALKYDTKPKGGKGVK